MTSTSWDEIRESARKAVALADEYEHTFDAAAEKGLPGSKHIDVHQFETVIRILGEAVERMVDFMQDFESPIVRGLFERTTPDLEPLPGPYRTDPLSGNPFRVDSERGDEFMITDPLGYLTRIVSRQAWETWEVCG